MAPFAQRFPRILGDKNDTRRRRVAAPQDAYDKLVYAFANQLCVVEDIDNILEDSTHARATSWLVFEAIAAVYGMIHHQLPDNPNKLDRGAREFRCAFGACAKFGYCHRLQPALVFSSDGRITEDTSVATNAGEVYGRTTNAKFDSERSASVLVDHSAVSSAASGTGLPGAGVYPSRRTLPRSRKASPMRTFVVVLSVAWKSALEPVPTVSALLCARNAEGEPDSSGEQPFIELGTIEDDARARRVADGRPGGVVVDLRYSHGAFAAAVGVQPSGKSVLGCIPVRTVNTSAEASTHVAMVNAPGVIALRESARTGSGQAALVVLPPFEDLEQKIRNVQARLGLGGAAHVVCVPACAPRTPAEWPPAEPSAYLIARAAHASEAAVREILAERNVTVGLGHKRRIVLVVHPRHSLPGRDALIDCVDAFLCTVTPHEPDFINTLSRDQAFLGTLMCEQRREGSYTIRPVLRTTRSPAAQGDSGFIQRMMQHFQAATVLCDPEGDEARVSAAGPRGRGGARAPQLRYDALEPPSAAAAWITLPTSGRRVYGVDDAYDTEMPLEDGNDETPLQPPSVSDDVDDRFLKMQRDVLDEQQQPPPLVRMLADADDE